MDKEIAKFIKLLFQPEKNKSMGADNYPNVSLIFSCSRDNTLEIVDSYKRKGYEFINHTTSLYSKDTFDTLSQETKLNSHNVMGQEFDKVLVVINEMFYYQDGALTAKAHANPDYIFSQLLYQEITRAKNKLTHHMLLKRLDAVFVCTLNISKTIMQQHQKTLVREQGSKDSISR